MTHSDRPIGIPYAFGEYIDGVGLERTCPACGAKCLDPINSYDDDGEQKHLDSYQRHYYAHHLKDDEDGKVVAG